MWCTLDSSARQLWSFSNFVYTTKRLHSTALNDILVSDMLRYKVIILCMLEANECIFIIEVISHVLWRFGEIKNVPEVIEQSGVLCSGAPP